MGQGMDDFRIYIHVPWCSRRCGYCDFYAGVTRDAQVLHQGGQRLLKDLERQLARPVWSTGAVLSVYLGGGTPSLMPASWFAELLGSSFLKDRLAPGAEITVELNPEHLDTELAEGLARAGVNRVSLGAQSTRPEALAFLDREHGVSDLERGLALLRARGISEISMDLIYQLPGQGLAELDQDLDTLLALDVPHLSAYGLGYEPGTRLDLRRRQGRVTPLDGDRCARLYRHLSRRLELAGLVHYEVSSFCRPGHESAHNRGYWLGDDCLAVGPGASAWMSPARAARFRHDSSGPEPEAPWGLRLNHLGNLRLFNQAVDQGQAVPAERDAPDREAALLEAVYLGLRWRGGLERSRIAARFGQDQAEALWHRARCFRHRFRHCNRERLELEPGQWVLLDELVLELLRPGPAG
jgi:oxygen-independent coproporphyrinogen-3 oxidase